MKEKIHNIAKQNMIILVIIMSAISTYALDTRFDFEKNEFSYIKMSMFIFPLTLITLYNSYNILREKRKYDKKDTKRLLIVSYIFGILISIFVAIGRLSLVTFDPNVLSFSNTKIMITKKIVMYILLTNVGVTIFAKNALIVLFNMFEKIGDKRKTRLCKEENFACNNSINCNDNNNNNNNSGCILSANMKSLIIVAIILMIAWIPTLLARYPGLCTFDNKYQITQVINGRYINDHPLLHTLLYGGIVELGNMMFGSYNAGVLLVSVVKMIFASIVCSYVLYYLAKKKAPITYRKILLLFFMFYQPVAQHAMMGHKDITFAMIILLMTMHLIEIVSNTKEYFVKNSNIVVFAILILLSLFYRHNALYAYVLILPVLLLFLYLFNKKYVVSRKDGQVRRVETIKKDQIAKVIFAFLLSIVVYTGTIKVLTTYAGIGKGNSIEKYSILAQIVGRNVREHEDELTKEDREKINKFFYSFDLTQEEKIEKIKKDYNPWFADPIKNALVEEEIVKNEKEFVSFAMDIIRKFKLDSLQAVFSQTYLYYYPNYQLLVPVYEAVEDNNNGGFGKIDIYPDPKIDKGGKIINYTNNMYYGYIPVFSLFVNIAYILYFVLASFMYAIYKKRYIYMVAFLPLIGIYISVLFSPIGGETRYILPLFTTSTVLIPFAIGVLDNNYEKL